MDRRAILATLLGRGIGKADNAQFLPPPDTTLTPYSGSWGFEQAAHLLRRATFAPTQAMIKEAADKGLEATIDLLFQDLPLPEPPVNYYYANDSVPIGATWINASYNGGSDISIARERSLQAWTLGLLLEEGISIREKMTLFWHNHFAINEIQDSKFVYRYITLLRTNAWGNFRALVKAITIDPAMLRFLNGNQNTKNAPNENYARELMELFTIGKGEQVGAGDYTTFTEQDVAEMARALTGWRDRGYLTEDENEKLESFFDEERHDPTPKQLSHRFGNAVINDMGDQEYAHLVDIIFQQREVARFICRKFYRWFVYYKIDDAIENDIIEPMAQMLIDSDFEAKPVLKALLKSEHFFNVLSIGPMIKNPLDFVVSVIKPLAIELPTDLKQRYTTLLKIFQETGPMQMQYYNPPEVAGWKPYYQKPAFYRIWINASTLTRRMAFVDNSLYGGLSSGDGDEVKLDVLKFVGVLDDPYDPNEVIKGFARILFPQPLTPAQITGLKEILLPGLPDYEWGVEYTDYEANPNDMQLANALDSKLRDLIATMMKMAEFYLS